MVGVKSHTKDRDRPIVATTTVVWSPSFQASRAAMPAPSGVIPRPAIVKTAMTRARTAFGIAAAWIVPIVMACIIEAAPDTPSTRNSAPTTITCGPPMNGTTSKGNVTKMVATIRAAPGPAFGTIGA